ncbi:GNAT family N-acetyltransferase [Nocardia tengchongensis]|uniref:GNAT family N-acetyltransferase n=1 Tax=Nocardia tengchongensis TaxID=2055889 RepID=UPI0036A1DF00
MSRHQPTGIEIEIRPARPPDIDVLAELGMTIHQLHVDGRPDVFREVDRSALREFFQSQIRDGMHVLIASIEQEPVGYLLAEHRRRQADAFRHELSILYIHHLAVSPAARRKGIGTKLIDAAASTARELNASGLRLDSWQFNTAAHEFFRAHGFSPMNVVFERDLHRGPRPSGVE